MPTYIIRDTKRRKEFDVFYSWSELQDFLKNNPHCIKVVTAAAVVGDHIKKKTDGGMKEVFSKIAEKHPNSALADRFSNKSNAKVRAETIARKHGLVKDGGQNLSKKFKKNKDTGLY